MVWEQRGPQGGHWWGWDGPWFIATVAWYGRSPEDPAVYWVGYLQALPADEQRVTDRCATAEVAMRQVEAAHEARTAG